MEDDNAAREYIGRPGVTGATLKADLRTLARDAQSLISKPAHAADQTIRSHPYESIGLAFGIGILLGVLIGKKSS